MNHTEVRFSCICQKVKDEITNVLDCTYIGIDDTFTVSNTNIVEVEQFKSRNFYRVPCTACEAYIKKYIPRNRYQSYDFAYLTEHLLDGTKITPHYRIIRLKLEIPVLNPYSQNRAQFNDALQARRTYTYTIPTSSGQPVIVATPEATLSDYDSMYLSDCYDGYYY